MSSIELLTGPGSKILATLIVDAVDLSIPTNKNYLQKNLKKKI